MHSNSASRALRAATRDLLRRLCESVEREMQLRAELERLKRELAEAISQTHTRH